MIEAVSQVAFGNQRISLANNDESVLTLTKLTCTGLEQLIAGDICAIRVPNFIDKALAHIFGAWACQNAVAAYTHELYDERGLPYQAEYGVRRLGTPYNSTYGKTPGSKEHRHYYSDAPITIELMQKYCYPHLTPMEKFLAATNAIWKRGGKVAHFDGLPMFYGIIRKTEPNAEILQDQPHCDALNSSYTLSAQFSANIYLDVPEYGGELELWKVPVLSLEAIRNIPSDFNWREVLPEPILIKPQIGDLIIFNTRRPHAVRVFEKGNRISMQSFIGYNPNEPLWFWS